MDLMSKLDRKKLISISNEMATHYIVLQFPADLMALFKILLFIAATWKYNEIISIEMRTL